MSAANIGVIGMGVMGRNLALNFADRGQKVLVWNHRPESLQRAVSESGGKLHPAATLAALVAGLERPRRLLLMVPAGEAVDGLLRDLRPLLERDDVVIDGGNSWFEDTQRRERELSTAGLHFVGLGVSGGEEGARHGPSLMPGGSAAGYQRLRPVLESIAARSESGPCVTHVGEGGAGHFVKMVHNGIEYADMQAIAEAYHCLRALLGLEAPRLAEVFAEWNRGPLESFLIEITAAIFQVRDPRGGGALVDQVLDRAGQKGTGRWTAQVALELGVAIPSIAAAIDARVLSAAKASRQRFAPLLAGPAAARTRPKLSVEQVRDALHATKILAYAQGFALIRAGAEKYGWAVDLREIARIWKAGCIIRARFLDTVRQAFDRAPQLESLAVDGAVRADLARLLPNLRTVVATAAEAGVPLPACGASLAYYDALRSPDLPQNLVQAQRDAFGSHTYQRVDDPEGPPVHTDWLGAAR
jgi:6-phosphogluconate dehydrogenase